MTEPAAGPVVSSTGGGIGARLAALTTIVALVAVVLVAVTGRAPAPAPPPSPPVAVLLSPTPTRAQEPTPTPNQTPIAPMSPTPRPAGVAVYVIAGLIGGATFRTELVEMAPDLGLFSAQYTVPDPVLRSGTLAFEITPDPTAPRSRGDTLGVFLLDLESLAANHRSGREGHRAEIAGRPALVDAPLPVRRGFELSVSVALAFDHVATVDFQLSLTQQRRASLEGNDGVIGCLPLETCEEQD
jgi:hypothetical protein